MVEGGQGEVRGACAPPPHPKSPHLDPPPNRPSRSPPPQAPPRPPSSPSLTPPLPPPHRGLRPTVSWGGSWRPDPRGRPPPGRLGVPRPSPTPGVGQHHLCPCLPRGAVPWGPAPPRPPRRGLEWVVAHPPPSCGRPGLAVSRPGPRWPRVREQGGHCRPGPAVEVPPGPLRARPPARRPERRPPLHMALVLGTTVEGGDRNAGVAADPAPPGGALEPPQTTGTSADAAASLSSRDRRPPRCPTPVAVDWWGRVWDNNPACQPPPPDPEEICMTGDVTQGGI